MRKETVPPIHPGEILKEEFMEPLGLSQTQLAADIGVPARRINEIVLGKRAVTAETAMLLGKYFGNAPRFWLNLQAKYELDCADADAEIVKKVARVRPRVETSRDARQDYPTGVN
ncbi:MAG: HigA family addiction module antitoxin [Candidatus Xenobia bacterium]